jgi:hypothetical protein
VKFVLQVGFPVGLLVVPMFLVGQPKTILAVGFVLGVVMSLLALGTGGFAKSLAGGVKTARFYALFGAGMAVLAAFITMFVNADLPKLVRPVVQAQVSMMPSVIWGGAAGLLLAAGAAMLLSRPT